jgi:hypothetical protein
MKINDIINESGGVGSLTTGTRHALPSTEVFPNLKNTDPYLQYRFGLAVAAAKAVQAGHVEYNKESPFGEDLTMIARGPEEQEIIALAKKLYGADSNSKQISTTKSEENPSVGKQSPVAKPKKNKYGV